MPESTTTSASSTTPPVACTLDAGALQKRLAHVRAIGAGALRSVTREPHHVQLRFARSARIRERLEALVAAEERCCAFLAFELRDERDALVLAISAPPDAGAMAHELADAFAGPA